MSTAPEGAPDTPAPLRRSILALALLSFLVVLPSTHLWFGRVIELMPWEFDWFLGLVRSNHPELQRAIIYAGRLVQLLLLLGVGFAYRSLVEKTRESAEAVTKELVVRTCLLLGAIWLVGIPWVNIDVSFYLATGWLDFHYHLSPYTHTLSEAPGFAGTPLYENVIRTFRYGTSGYGPLFQFVSKWIAALSFGSLRAGMVLHKVLCATLYTVSCWVVFRASPARTRLVAVLLYAVNPLMLFSILTATHNDQLMNLLVLLAVWQHARRPWLAGACLGAATAVKYIPLVLLPLFVLAVFLDARAGALLRRLGRTTTLVLGYLAALVLPYVLLYPEAIQVLRALAKSGIAVRRNSLLDLFQWPRLFGRPVEDPDRLTLVVLFLLLYAVLAVAMIVRARSEGRFPLVASCVGALLLYFVIANQTNQEWYLTWVLSLTALLPTSQRVVEFNVRLGMLFLPLVVFTWRNPLILQMVSNTLLYLLLVWSTVFVLPALLREKIEPEGA